MKKYSFLTIVVSLATALCPLFVYAGGTTEKSAENKKGESITQYDYDFNSVSVFNPIDESVTDMSMRDYVIGALAEEMPASYSTEALKAQAVVCLTYAEYKKIHNSDDEKGDISADASTNQGYITVEEMKEKWGDNYDKYYEKIADAVDSVIDYVITYNGEPIDAVFCAISSGKTENAVDVWGEDVPYLKSVDSLWDKYSAGYVNNTAFISDRVKEALKDIVDVTDDENKWFTDIKKDSAGRVRSVNVCGKEFTGEEIRKLFDLRSTHFDISYDEGYFTFRTVGYGHGVGMSQYGAEYMAQNGSTWEEIIKHYYTDVEIIKSNRI